MNKELIKTLKEPAQALRFELLESINPEAAEIIRKAYPFGCQYFSREWKDCMAGKTPSPSDTYILKPSYEPEPEYEDWEIRTNPCDPPRLYAWYAETRQEMSMAECDEHPALYGYLAIDTTGEHYLNRRTDVANHKHDGHKVVARFRTE